jgi:hypothetical protein
MAAMSWSLNSTATAHRNNVLNVRMDAVAGGSRSIRELNGTYLIMLERPRASYDLLLVETADDNPG